MILGQAVTLLFFYDLPTKLDEHNRVLDRMREQRYAIREEAKLLENERIALRRESNHLERERLALDASTLKMEGERDALESAILRSELERARLEREKLLLEDERQMLEEKKGELRDERLLLEHEKVELREERERWERAREDRVPQGAFWEVIWPAWDCRAYGKREYWGELQNIPGDWTDLEACMNMPAEIKGVTVRRPDRCEYVDGSPHIHAFWMVDWDQPDCKPWHQDITDMVSGLANLSMSLITFHVKGCTNTGSGIRRIEAWVVGINDRPEQDWRLLCESTPFTWNHVTYKSPTHCEAGVSTVSVRVSAQHSF